MNARMLVPVRLCWAVSTALALVSGPAIASQPIVLGERLSDWILRHPAYDNRAAYWSGLSWQNTAQQAAQASLKTELLTLLSIGDDDQRWTPLITRLNAMPVTGRVVLRQADARWLQANPSHDPILSDGDRLVLADRPSSVTVLMPDGRLCQPAHVSDAFAADYARSCAIAAGLPTPDWAWVAQPDGKTMRVGLASWNGKTQDHLAPGAWVWSPMAGWDPGPRISERMIGLLAMQGPAPDGDGHSSGIVLRPGNVLKPSGKTVASPRNLDMTGSDWGEIGLMQTPTARMAPAGGARVHFSRVWPYTRGTAILQPFDWLEGGFRYTDVANRLYGAEIAGTQSYKDKSIDFKLRLLEEDRWWPQVSLGVRDFGGTGLFSGEYLVASKRYGDFDFSVGLGWGYLGGRGNLPNPLGLIAPGFKIRPDPYTNPSGGTANFQSMFRGRTALFGGLQWQTPWPAWVLKAELDGNDYQSEPQGNRQTQKSPFNVGAVWHARPGLDLTMGLERGNRLMVGFSLTGDLSALSMPKIDKLAPLPLNTRWIEGPARQVSSWAPLVAAVEEQLSWRLDEVNESGEDLHLRISDAFGAYRSDRVERITALAHSLAPPQFRRFVLRFGQRNLDDLEVMVIDRQAWVQRQTSLSRPDEAVISPAVATTRIQTGTQQPSWVTQDPGIKFGVSPTYGQILGGPDGFLLYQLGVAGDVQLRLGSASWMTGVVQLRVLDNFDKFKYTAPSELPRVRTYLREYVTGRRVKIPYLQFTHLGRLSEDNFFMAYGGLLEPMFAGWGGEWMWRPPRSRVSLSVDINRVRQRSFDQDFSLRDYEVTTGHGTVRWNTGWQGATVTASAGQYLAGDRGITLDVSRTFGNGTSIGAFVTKTNISAKAFGEGSFDKGIYVSVPLDAFLIKSSNGYVNMLWKPLTRDGGAKLNRVPTLHGVTQIRDIDAFSFKVPD